MKEPTKEILVLDSVILSYKKALRPSLNNVDKLYEYCVQNDLQKGVCHKLLTVPFGGYLMDMLEAFKPVERFWFNTPFNIYEDYHLLHKHPSLEFKDTLSGTECFHKIRDVLKKRLNILKAFKKWI